MDDVTLLTKAAGGLGMFLLGMLIITDGLRTLAGNNWRHAWQHAEKTADTILAQRQSRRARIVSDSALDQLTIPESTERLQALRWMVRVSHHLARIAHYLDRTTNAAGKDA